jgi:hypothetical protein
MANRPLLLVLAVFLATCVSAAFAATPTITINGLASGVSVSPGAPITIAVTNGPGNPHDWIGVCNSGVTPSPAQCDGAGYSWEHLNCTQTPPAAGLTSATCSLSAPEAAGNYIVGFFSNATYTVLASAPFQVTSPFSPSITVNGTSSGTTVSAGASVSVAVANGPGNPHDWMGVCNAGVPISSRVCDGAGYSWEHLNCTQTPPAAGLTSATCSLTAPSAAGSYIVGFFSNATYTVLASAPFQVTSPSTGVTVVQSAGVDCNDPNNPGGVPEIPNTGNSCVWPLPQHISAGNTVVGFVHFSNANDAAENYPSSVTDDAGNTYNLSAGVHWLPWPEDIGIFYLTNVQGNPTQITVGGFAQTPSGDFGFTEYSGASSVLVVNPVYIAGDSPSITLTPTSTASLFVFESVYGPTDSYPISASTPISISIDHSSTDNIAVWNSNSAVSPGSYTFTWNAPLGAPGSCSNSSSGCGTVVMGASVQ